MAFATNKKINEDKHTGWTARGKEIVLTKSAGIPESRGKGILGLPAHRQLEVVAMFAVTGDIVKTAEYARVPVVEVRRWRREPWFTTLLEEIQDENDAKLDAKFTELLHTSLDIVADRLVNGDFVVLRDGSTVRKPVNLKDVTISNAIIVDKRQLLRGKPTSRTESSQSPQQVLETLAQTFIKLAQNKNPSKEVVIEDVEYTEITESIPETGSGDSIHSTESPETDFQQGETEPCPEVESTKI